MRRVIFTVPRQGLQTLFNDFLFRCKATLRVEGCHFVIFRIDFGMPKLCSVFQIANIDSVFGFADSFASLLRLIPSLQY